MMVKPFSTRSVAAILAVVVVASRLQTGSSDDPNDSFEIQCDMTPSHLDPTISEQMGECPFKLEVMSDPIRAGTLVNMSLSSLDGVTPFRAFMIQARENNSDRAIGIFMPTCKDFDNWMYHHSINCTDGGDPNNTVIQTNDNLKLIDYITWLVPPGQVKNITFRYTVIQDEKHYWTNQETEEFSVFTFSKEYTHVKSQLYTYLLPWYMAKYNHINCLGPFSLF